MGKKKNNNIQQLAASVFIACAAACSHAEAQTPDVLFEQISPSIWSVLTYDPNGRPLRQGSAVVTGPGRLVTNCHVLARSRSVEVAKDNVKYLARLEFPDTQRDLCQLQVRNFTAPAVKIGTVRDLKVGQRVYAIGSPKGLELTMSDGIISSLRSTSTDDQPLIQTTAAISAGSSGGGLFSSDGLLIGITTFVVKDSQNLNFAHPAEWIADIPERAKLQLAKYQESKTAAGAEAVAPAPPVETLLTGSELGELLRPPRKIKIISGPENLELMTFVSSDGVNMQFRMASRGGTYSLQPAAGKLCMQFSTHRYYTMLIPYNDCFSVWRISGRKYRFKATDQTEFIGEG